MSSVRLAWRPLTDALRSHVFACSGQEVQHLFSSTYGKSDTVRFFRCKRETRIVAVDDFAFTFSFLSNEPRPEYVGIKHDFDERDKDVDKGASKLIACSVSFFDVWHPVFSDSVDC